MQEDVVENVRTLMDQFHRDTFYGIGGGPGDVDKMCVNSKPLLVNRDYNTSVDVLLSLCDQLSVLNSKKGRAVML